MNIREFKQSLELKTYKPQFTVIQTGNNEFVCYQYLDHIKDKLGFMVIPLDDISAIYDDFLVLDPKAVYVYKCDKLDFKVDLAYTSNLIIITKIIDKNYKDYYDPYLIDIPELEPWMLKDYAYSLLPDVKTDNLDWLINICNNDIYRLDNELRKIMIFDRKYHNNLFSTFMQEGAFSDLSSYTIFNLSNALQVKDIETVENILRDMKNIDIEPVGLITVMYQNIKKLIIVWLNPNPTPENTGLKSNQIYAIRKLPHNYSNAQLVAIFQFLLKLDYRLKTGELPVDCLIDYIIINILAIQ